MTREALGTALDGRYAWIGLDAFVRDRALGEEAAGTPLRQAGLARFPAAGAMCVMLERGWAGYQLELWRIVSMPFIPRIPTCLALA